MLPRSFKWLSTGLLCFVANAASAQPAETPKTPDDATPPAASDGAPPAASDKPATPTDGPTPEQIEEAKTLFRKATELRKAGEYQRAYALYQRSRAIVPRVSNTINAAFCLNQLGRSDEALELYEELLTEFSSDLSDEQRKSVAYEMNVLRPKVGSIQVSANVNGGQLVIDGRSRGDLPRLSPVRVLPGKHQVRVIKDGYETFEKSVKVQAGRTLSVDARLKALTNSGRLRVETRGVEGAQLFVDGAQVGTTPWEGTLAPGKHVVFVQMENLGTAPTLATVVEGQTVLVSADPKPLGPEMRVLVQPPAAKFSINGIPLGAGSWQGRLPLGTHIVEAREEGYIDGKITLTVTDKSEGDNRLKLKIDPDHPRWVKPDPSLIYVQGLFGVGLGTTIGATANDDCASGLCTDEGLAVGPLAALRAGYQFPLGIAIELSAGYMSLSQSIKRNHDATWDQGRFPITYQYTDELQLSGFFATVGAAYRFNVGALGFDVRAHVGALAGRGVNRITAAAESDGQFTDQVGVDNAGAAATGLTALALPGIAARYSFDDVFIGLELNVPIVITDGPKNEHGETIVELGQCQPESCIGNARGANDVNAERAFGPTLLIAPALTVGYTF